MPQLPNQSAAELQEVISMARSILAKAEESGLLALITAAETEFGPALANTIGPPVSESMRIAVGMSRALISLLPTNAEREDLMQLRREARQTHRQHAARDAELGSLDDDRAVDSFIKRLLVVAPRAD